MKEQIMKVAGTLLLALGVSTADSEKLWIPLILVSAGALVLWRWNRQF